MELNNESVNAYTKILKDPKTHGLPIRPLSECFEDAELVRPKHLLFEDYMKEVGSNLLKVMFYIIMDTEYSTKIAKAPNGDLGYLLKFKEATSPNYSEKNGQPDNSLVAGAGHN